MQYPQVLERIQSSRTQMYMHNWGSAGIFDVTAITSTFFRKNNDDYCRNDKITAAMSKGDTSIDKATRLAAYKEAFQEMAIQLCQIPLFNYGAFFATSNKLNWSPTPDEVHAWYRASWSK